MQETMLFDAQTFAQKTHVSQETLAAFSHWHAQLAHWNTKINLVAPASLHYFWLRHALDSWQLFAHLPNSTSTLIDLGAGAGFPGIAMAIGFKHHGHMNAKITLVEANGKKCVFLRTLIRELGLPAHVQQNRIEDLPAQKFDVITARAFAALPKLLSFSLPFLGANTVMIFPKGEHWQKEVKAARQSFTFDLKTTPSQTAKAAMILHITNLAAREVTQ